MPVDDRDLCRRHLRHRVDLSAQQRVHPRSVVREVDDHDLVEVRLPGAPVIRVAGVRALLSGREARQLERTCADVRLRLAVAGRPVAHRDDAGGVLGERVEDGGVRVRERHPDSALVQQLDPGRVECREKGLPAQGQLLVHEALQRVSDVGGGEGLAVVELDPRPYPDRPDVGFLVGCDLLRQPVELEPELGVEDDERLPAGQETRDVGLGDDVLPVDEVLGRSAGHAKAEGAAALGCRPHGGVRRRRQSTAGDDHEAARGSTTE